MDNEHGHNHIKLNKLVSKWKLSLFILQQMGININYFEDKIFV